MKFRTLQEMQALLTAPVAPSTRILYELWDQRQFSTDPKSAKPAETLPTTVDWLKQDLSLAVSFVRCALKREEYLLVSDAAREALPYWHSRDQVNPGHLSELAAGFARAKSRTGQTAEALRSLEPWSRDSRLDVAQRSAILIQLGDILSEEAHCAVDPSARFQRGERALSRYVDAAKLTPTSIEARVKVASALLSIGTANPARQ